MRKVLIIAERFYPEEFIINDLAQEWAAKDFEVDVLTQIPSYPFGKIFKGYSNRLWGRERWQNITIFRFFTVTGYRESLFLKLLNYFSFAAVGSIAALAIGGKQESGSAPVNFGEGFHFTFAGNVGRHQNLPNMIRGFGLARAIHPDMRLNIVGDGSALTELKEIAERENIGGVVFWGRKKSFEMPPFFRASDVMIVCLRDHPIFAVIKGDVKDMVERYGVGLYAAPESPDMIRDGFLRFREMTPAQLENFSKKAGELLNKFYNREKIIAGMMELVI